MKKLSTLARHLLRLPGVNRDKIEAFADLGKLSLCATDLGQGFEIGKFRYDAVFSIERFPAAQAQLLLAVLAVWIAENDPGRDLLNLNDPDVDVTLEDEQTAFVQISIEFEEPLSIVPDPAGPITWEGQQWRVDDVPIDVADTVDKLENT
ncbi:MAG: phage tail protein [Desulfobacteraceae bacterium]|nr:phage tail protein [Desulfobacteraceae bacterium]